MSPETTSRQQQTDVDVDASLLFEAATAGNLSLLRQQQSHNLLLKTRDHHGSSLLHYAAGSGQVECCQYLLNFDESRVTTTDTTTANDDDDDNGGAILKANNNNNVGLLLDLRSSNNGRTALHWAARNGRTETVRLLAKTMIQQNKKRQRQRHDKYQNNNDVRESSSSSLSVVDVLAKGEVTPLQLAIWQCHLSTAKCLVGEFQANPYFVNAWGCSVAHWLGKCPNNVNTTTATTTIATTTTTENDDTNKVLVENDEQMMIITTIQQQQQDCCHWLFDEYDIPHNNPNHYGQTPLHKAAFANNFIVAKYLVHNMNVIDNIRDNQGNIAADCAERSQNLVMAKWLRRFASPCIRQALDCLFGVDEIESSSSSSFPSPMGHIIMIPPPISKLRGRYLQLVKKFHPDRKTKNDHNCHHSPHPSPTHHIHNDHCYQRYHSLLCTSSTAATTTATATIDNNNNTRNDYWNEIQDAYSLLRDWHENPILCDTRIRIRTRNAALLDFLPLCWYESWHSSSSFRCSQKQQYQSSSPTNASKGKEGTATTTPTPKALQEFERRLIRLLTPLGDEGISISQLPKEYEKNWHKPVPKPRDYKCRRLLQLVKKYCPNITVVEEKKPTKLGIGSSGKKKEPRQPSQQARLICAPHS